MRNRYKGICQICKKEVPPKQGRWREGGITAKSTQNFSGLRCADCSTTTKKNIKKMAEKGIIIN